MVWTSISSGLIGIGGILFGYYAGLPAALHFLLKQQCHNGQVEAMISIEKYFSFVVAYMVGAALMFQLPLLLIIINRIKPLTPQKMFKYERAVIMFAFVSAFIMNPTPNVVDQMLTVIPVLISYQVGILIVWLVNKKNARRRYATLFDQDTAARDARLERARTAARLPSEVLSPAQPEAPLRSTTMQKTLTASAANIPQPRAVSPKYLSPRPGYVSSGGRVLQI
ncbi:twin-arginine translocase subunit TatC [Candidatus Saccharibacteria bacterium]|nr:MAG: twin-arginine translocase subunit TatC [Candidatus Saccharibacteria bacterium]